ncbi:MAG: hypothetical protein EOP49_29030, partial [Sphingobacteriales bacterium]
MECIILAGGLGTRLQETIGSLPKCMAPVNGEPFLHYLLEYLGKEGCTSIILSLGYKNEVIREWLSERDFAFKIRWVIEKDPLGTGGGIALAMKEVTEADVIVMNGDTLFQVPLTELMDFHLGQKAETTLALKHLTNFDRYGTVSLTGDGYVKSFHEKQLSHSGEINGGVYV